MTTITFTIPNAQIPAVAEALVAHYAEAARDLHLMIDNSEPRLAAVEAMRTDDTLREIDRLLVPLHWGCPPDDEDARLDISPARLVHMLRTAVCDATDALADACGDFLNGGTEDYLRTSHDQLGALLSLLTAARALAADEVPVTVSVYGRTARMLHGEALATGRSPITIVAAAVGRWVGRS
jgi:hypothetical protein